MVLIYCLFWASVVAVLYVVLVYPLLTFLLAKALNHTVAKADIEPTLSLIIAAYNEAASIEETLQNMVLLDYPIDKLQIIVVSDGSQDQTEAIVENFAARNIELTRTGTRVGKTAAIQSALHRARGEILVFTDATTRLAPDAMRQLAANFADPSVGGVCGRVLYDYDNSLMARGKRLYQWFIVKQRMNESRFGNQLVLSGAIHAIRRECFTSCPPYITPELWHVLAIVQQGLRVVYDPGATAREQARSAMGPEFRARVRDNIQSFAFLKLVCQKGVCAHHPCYLFQVYSHLACRWTLVLPLATMLAASLLLAGESRWFLLTAVAQFGAYLFGLLGVLAPRSASRIPGSAAASYLLVFLAASVVAGLQVGSGCKQTTWETERDAPAASAGN